MMVFILKSHNTKNIPKKQMSKTLNPDKQNTTATFYQTYQLPQTVPIFQTTFKLLNSNSDAIDQLTIESQSLMQKLIDRVGLDQVKTEKRYLQLEEIGRDIEGYVGSSNRDKENEQIVKNNKEAVREMFAARREQYVHAGRKAGAEIKNIAERFDFVQKEIQYEKIEREDTWSQLIDTFQKEIVQRDREFKSMRNRQQNVFEEMSLHVYQLDQQIQNSVEKEVATRKQEQDTVIRLVSQCIQSVRYIY